MYQFDDAEPCVAEGVRPVSFPVDTGAVAPRVDFKYSIPLRLRLDCLRYGGRVSCVPAIFIRAEFVLLKRAVLGFQRAQTSFNIFGELL